jgi:glutamate carboxypeptidase
LSARIARTLRRLAACSVLVGSTAGAAINDEEARIAATADAGLSSAIELLAETVNVPSATENLAGVRKAGAIYARELSNLGFETRWLELPSEMRRAGHLLAERRGSHGRRILLIGRFRHEGRQPRDPRRAARAARRKRARRHDDHGDADR